MCDIEHEHLLINIHYYSRRKKAECLFFTALVKGINLFDFNSTYMYILVKSLVTISS